MKSKSGVAGGVRSSAPQNFGVFPDSGMVYAPHRPKTAEYPRHQRDPAYRKTSQEVGVRRVGERGARLPIKPFFLGGFLMRLALMYTFSRITAIPWYP